MSEVILPAKRQLPKLKGASTSVLIDLHTTNIQLPKFSEL